MGNAESSTGTGGRADPIEIDSISDDDAPEMARRSSRLASAANSRGEGLRWRPMANDVDTTARCPELVVLQGDLTECEADAIVNPANSRLAHGAGVAGAIASKGGPTIQDESDDWIDKHGKLPVGMAMSTTAGRLPSRFVIHTVGPFIGRGFTQPTPEQAQALRDAVWNALCEAERLGLASIAISGISTGLFGYPRGLAAREIVGECVRFCREQAASMQDTPTTLATIVLMNIDTPTCESFAKALREAAAMQTDPASERARAEPASCSKIEPLDGEYVTVNKAASSFGVMVVRAGESDFEVLLGVEFRLFRGRFLTVVSGRHPHLGQSDTSTVSDLINGLIPKSELDRALEHASRSLELKPRKYTLHIIPLDHQRTHKLPDAYEARSRRWLGSSAVDHLVWVPWRAVEAAAFEASKKIHARMKYGRRVVPTSRGVLPVSESLTEMIEHHGQAIQRQLEDLLVEHMIADEVARVQSLKTLDNTELVTETLDGDWNLRLTSPPLPPLPPLEPLKPHDPAYQSMIKALPQSIASRVVSVRRVRASARIGDYLAHKQSRASGTTHEKAPLFHGTPERWRATAIALNGFDTSIKLNGRACGDGVYTATDASTAAAYSKTEGSMLSLRGLVTTNSPKTAHNTIIRGTVHVFPDHKALLPLMIADYVAEDARDQLEMQRKRQEENHDRLLKRRRDFHTVMAAKEEEFKEVAGNRLRAALGVYSARLTKLKKQIAGKSEKANSGARAMSASRQFFLERRHFQLSLPMYEVKPALVKLLLATPVVVVVAETGSGKSTQLPQILLDDVLPATETRRIAILEPRRVNAISLCKRVSEERGLLPGHEVGYTIGRGDSKTSHGVTRLEFMTHGLFVQLARDFEQLMSNYCAVIVDEAHERSVDVDLSLALLQRALKRLRENVGGNTRSSRDFRVIVASATIGSEAEKFQRYLDASMAQSAIFRVHGRAFPVHVEHRDDVELDREAIGSAGTGKVLTSAAIQAAVELLRTTESGNILVFLAGEGSINDALEVARNEIATSATVEGLDSFSTGYSAFCFRMSVRSASDGADDTCRNASRVITTCVASFHGKISRAERDRVLNPRCADWRLVIFTTNIAETGVTVPNVRYVIDTGLERRVRWNADLDMNEMVTSPISVSSMIQRSGRAGRTASGICIRLYPKESIGGLIQPEVVPAVQTAMIYKAVLLNKQLEGLGEPSLELLDPIEPKAFARAERRLVDLGALNEQDGTLTREGAALLRVGIDLRIGRFLIACARFGSLATGVKLASLLVAADAPERLLPGRKKSHRTERLRSLVDPSGDHMTLLNIVEAYEDAERDGHGISWCQEMGFDFDVFVDAEASRTYLLKVLDSLQFPLLDDLATMARAGGKQACICRALCAAFYDQLARPRMARTANNGFIRILDESTSLKMQKNATQFGQHTQGKAAALAEANAGGDEGAADSDAGADSPGEPVVKLGHCSTLWITEVSARLATANHLVVFGSLILTDGSTKCEPTVQLLTCVTQEDVKAGAPEWCRIVDFDQLLKTSARETLEFDLARGMDESFLMHRGAWMRQLAHMFRSSVVATIRNRKLVVSFPRRCRARVEYHLRKQVQVVAPESVKLQLPDGVHMGKLIGKSGKQIEALNKNLDDLLSSEHRGAGHEHIRTRVLTADTAKKTITVTLQGASKPLMGVVVGRVQSAIVDVLGSEMLPLVLDASGERGQQMQQNPRLAQLLNRLSPSCWASRDDVMLQLAHVLVWKCSASIHGGFLRDWVVRGEMANDIDVQLSPPLTTAELIEQRLTNFFSQSINAQRLGLHVSRKWNKGAAFTLTIAGKGIYPIDIDLVDRGRLREVVASPGVDSDAGNLLLNRSESLRKKMISAGDSLSAALENTRQKRFVFYYPLEKGVHQAMSVKRLKQYLSRGWTCLSNVPHDVQDAFLSEAERALICPVVDAA